MGIPLPLKWESQREAVELKWLQCNGSNEGLFSDALASGFYEFKSACSRTIQNATAIFSGVGRITVDAREKE